MFNKTTTVQEYIRQKALGALGLISSDIDPRTRSERLTFVNNINEIQQTLLKEYNVWYEGSSDGLLNFYTRAINIDYNIDPLYNRNKKGYFWSVSSTESDIKRTHSGQPRNIVDTLVSIIGSPRVGVGAPDSVLTEIDEKLQKILKDNNFKHTLMQKARPFTFVEGWGAWKVNWDNNFRDTPILLYYRAEAVDFVYSNNQLIAIIYKDYYQDEKKNNYILFETRRLERRQTVDWGMCTCLIVEKDLFRIEGQSERMIPMELHSLPQLKDVQEQIIFEHYDRFLGCPCIFYEDPTGDNYGRSIFTGKLDLFDDLDQCLSQSANTVRRSTVHEYFNTLYLEKDEHTGLPKMPHDFDRKYVMFKGPKSGDGTNVGNSPVQVTQPMLNFNQYSAEEQNILLQAISGIMSPATLGIDIAKKDNAEAEREKEKVTIFTRNVVMEAECEQLKTLANDLLCASEFMRTGELTCKDYDVFVKYDEFADASFEAKLETVLTGWQAGIISDELAVDMLHKDSSKEIKKRELDYIKATKEQSMQGPDQEILGEMGAELGGMNEYDKQREHPAVQDAKEDLGIE